MEAAKPGISAMRDLFYDKINIKRIYDDSSEIVPGCNGG
jgi:hypothetical protein